jgi:hypothetical protein
MAPVSPAHRGDFTSMAGRPEPVADGSADRAPADRHFPCPLMPGDEQHYTLTASDRLVQGAVDRPPGAVQAHPVKVDHPIRLDGTACKTAIPAAVERGAKFSMRARCRPRRRGSS